MMLSFPQATMLRPQFGGLTKGIEAARGGSPSESMTQSRKLIGELHAVHSAIRRVGGMAGYGRFQAKEVELAELVKKMDCQEVASLVDLLEAGAYTPFDGDEVDLAFQQALQTQPEDSFVN